MAKPTCPTCGEQRQVTTENGRWYHCDTCGKDFKVQP